MDITILQNSLQTWLIALVTFIVTALGLRIVMRGMIHKLAKLAQVTETRTDDIAVAVLARTGWPFQLAAGLFAGSMLLELPQRLAATGRTALVLLLLVQLGIWGAVLLGEMLKYYRERAMAENPAAVTTINVIGFIGKLALWAILLLLFLDNLGINITALVTGLGIGGIAVALAVQNVLGDLFASLAIMLDKPFAVGDFLAIDDYLGSVEYVGLKTTRLRSLSGEQLVFSNSDLLKSRIRNYGRMFERRVVFSLGVLYETPRDKLKIIPGIIREAIEAQANTRFDRSHFMNYGAYALMYETVYYVLTSDYNAYMDIQQAIYFNIHERFEQEQIEFAYPTQRLIVEGETTAS